MKKNTVGLSQHTSLDFIFALLKIEKKIYKESSA